MIDIAALTDLIDEIVERRVAEALAAWQPDEWLDAEQAAAYTGRSVGTIHNLVCGRDPKLPRHGPRGHKLMFRRSDLDAYLDGRRVPAENVGTEINRGERRANGPAPGQGE